MDKDKIILGLIKFGAFSPDDATDFVNSLPNSATEQLQKIIKSIREDKSISEDFKKSTEEFMVAKN